MEKIKTIRKDLETKCLNIRYIFTLVVPTSLMVKEGSEVRKITGEVSWPIGSDIEAIKRDLVRRYNLRQKELNEEETVEQSNLNLSYDGVKWE